MKLGRLAQLQRREKILFWICVAAATFALVTHYVVGPFLAKWQEVETAIGQNELMLAKGTRSMAREDVLTLAYENVRGQILSEGSTEEEISAFLSEIESLSGGEIRITNIKPRSIDEGETMKQLSIELDLEAEIIPLSRFIHGLYESPMLLEVLQLDLSPKGVGSEVLKGHLIVSRILLRS